MHLKILPAFLVLLLFSGCLSKPELTGQNSGSLTIRMRLAESNSNQSISKAIASDIRIIKATLSMEKGDLIQEASTEFSGNDTQLSFEKVYPGAWSLTVCGLDQSNDIIFQGTSEVVIEQSQHATAEVQLKPASASLDIQFDASGIPGIGETIKSGRFGIELSHTDNQAKYYDLTLSGTKLSALIHNLPEGSYNARICIPDASSPVYTTPYFRVQLNAGKTSSVMINADGTIIIDGVIDSTPLTPTGLTVHLNGNIVELSWNPVIESDLAGYRIYRTDKNGRFCLLSTVSSATVQFNDAVTSNMTYNHRISYAVSSFDQGENESLWSNSQSVSF